MSALSRRRESARALACLFILGGLLGLMVDILVPPSPNMSTVGVFAQPLVALIAGVALWREAERVPERGLALALALGTTLISLGLYYGSDLRSSGQTFYLWATTYAFFTLSIPAALAEAAYMALAYGAVLLLRDEPTGLARWIITTVTLVVAGLFVARVVRQLDDLIRRGGEREEALAAAEAQFRSAFDDAAVGMALVGLDGNWLQVNEALARLTGYPRSELVGMSFRDLTPSEDLAADNTALAQLISGELNVHNAEKRYVRADGSIVWVGLSVSVVRDRQGVPQHLISQMQDITARKEAEAELTRQALHDPLTGLPNRLLFNDRVELALARIERAQTPVSVFFVDLDGFKLVNDSLGHDVGDQLLIAVAERFRSQIRPTDTIARFGGDEFTVVCENTDEDEAGLVADRILASLTQPFTVHNRELFVTASIGIAIAHHAHTPADEMLRDADAAMYRAKDLGRSRYAIFDGTMHTRASARLELETDLRRALEQHEFELVYQPDVELATGRMVGVEALIRWRHPRRGIVGPADFIDTAEQSGLIVPIGAWVVAEACEQAARWLADGCELSMAVNISPRQLADPQLRHAVRDALNRTGVPPERLTLEITETAAAHALGPQIDALRALGVRMAIDDFGSGFASLNQVRSLPTVDTLKIDRMFTSELGRRPADDAIISAVVTIAAAMGMTTIVEGIETELQAQQAKRLGCDRAQGWFFGRPAAPELLEQRFVAERLAS